MREKRALLLLTALSLVLTLLAGCGNTAPETGEKAMVIGDTTFNSENWEETVDPHRTYNGWACIRYGIGETLVRYTDSMELEPWLARSWSNDGDRTWTIVAPGPGPSFCRTMLPSPAAGRWMRRR